MGENDCRLVVSVGEYRAPLVFSTGKSTLATFSNISCSEDPPPKGALSPLPVLKLCEDPPCGLCEEKFIASLEAKEPPTLSPLCIPKAEGQRADMLIGGEETATLEFGRPLGLKDAASLPNAFGGDIAGLLLMLAAVLVLVGSDDEKEDSCDRTPD